MPLTPGAALRPPEVLQGFPVLVEPAGDVGILEDSRESQKTLEYAVVLLNVGRSTQREEYPAEVLETLGGGARVQ